jgi:hypothetical protein
VASSITVDVQMVSGGALGTPDGSPVSLSCGDSTSGLPSATTVKGLPQIPDGFVYNYTFGPTANSPDGGGSSSSGTRQSVTPIYDTLPAQIGTLTVN